ncbi:MAG: 6-phosphogluconolactonase [Phycisphaerales bacterium]
MSESARSPRDYDAAPLELVPALPRPALPGTVVVRAGQDEWLDAIASDLVIHAKNCVRTFGDFHLALSGGKTPEPLYRRLMYDPLCRDFPWKRTHLWVVDERRVPMDDERCNFRMIHETIVGHSDIPKEQVHPVRAMEDRADESYEAELREWLGWREKGHDRLDFVLLGMGSDGHTASLFPRSPALAVTGRLVVVNAGPSVTPPDRVTMTLEFINAARFVAVLVSGAGKREMVARVVARRDTVEDLPILGVSPVGGELRWYLDQAACPI